MLSIQERSAMKPKYPSFKINRHRGRSSNTRNGAERTLGQYSKQHGHNGSYTLKKNNRALAATLNHFKTQTQALTEKINSLNAENMELRVELAELKQDLSFVGKGNMKGKYSSGTYRKGGRTAMEDFEYEMQKKLAKHLEPMKACLHQSLNHTVRLSDSLSQALELASIPGVRSKSLNMINASPDQIELNRTGNGNPPNTYESRKNRNGSSLGLPAAPFPTNFMSNPSLGQRVVTAKVTPMVKGHGIHTKPKLQLPRLDINELNELTEQHSNLHIRPTERIQSAQPEEQRNVSTENGLIDVHTIDGGHGYEQIMSSSPSSTETGNVPSSVGLEDFDELTPSMSMNPSVENQVRDNQRVAQRRRKPKKKRSRFERTILHEEDENISDDDNMISHQIGLNIPLGANSSYVENGAVLLLPRVVLDRVTITSPVKSSPKNKSSSIKRKSSNRRSSIIGKIERDVILSSSPDTKDRRGSNANRKSIINSDCNPKSQHLRENKQGLSAQVVLPSLSLSPSVRLERCKNSIPNTENPKNEESTCVTPDELETLQQGVRNVDSDVLGASTEISETPTSRDSFENFKQEMFDMNPLEGPSWLFGESDENSHLNSANSGNGEALENRVETDSSKRNTKESKKWNINKRERSDALSLKARISGKASKRLSHEFQSPIHGPDEASNVDQRQNDVNEKCMGDVQTEHASQIFTSEDTNAQHHVSRLDLQDGNVLIDTSSSKSCLKNQINISLDTNNDANCLESNCQVSPLNNAISKNGVDGVPLNDDEAKLNKNRSSVFGDRDSISRPKRRAAVAAVGSLKEQPIGKKLRQGDPSTSSIYSAAPSRQADSDEKIDLPTNRLSKKLKK